MQTAQSESKPLWVRLLPIALVITLGLPTLLSFILRAHMLQWQMLALLMAAVWLLICGAFTTFHPMPIARYLARPGTYELMQSSSHTWFTRWYLPIAGCVLMLVALVIGVVSCVALLSAGKP